MNIFRAPQLRWPFYPGNDLEARKPQIVTDHQAMANYVEITRDLDRVDFLLEDPGGVGTGTNLWFEFSPVRHSIIFELKGHAKVAGAGNLVLQLRINGVALDTLTLTTGSTAVFTKTPAVQQKVSPTDKLSVDITSVSGTWRWVTFTVLMEPRYLWEV